MQIFTELITKVINGEQKAKLIETLSLLQLIKQLKQFLHLIKINVIEGLDSRLIDLTLVDDDQGENPGPCVRFDALHQIDASCWALSI